MANRCGALTRSAFATARSALHSKGISFTAEGKAASSKFSARIANDNTASPRRFTSISRLPAELACALSLIPLHSAVAAARLTSRLSVNSRNCRALSQGTLCCTFPDR
eukprot:Gb_01016 [translate_table: standard]